MKIADLDYYATFGNTFLHKISAKNKLLGAAVIIAILLYIKNTYILAIIYFLLVLLLVFSRLPLIKVLKVKLYPLIFMAIFLFSFDNLTFTTASSLILRVLAISTTFVFLIFTTPYIKIFKPLSRFLPDIMISIFFNTYRSIFIINNILENLITTVKLRGGFDISRPIHTIKTISGLIGFFVIKSIETSEKLNEGLKLRGYSDSNLFLKD